MSPCPACSCIYSQEPALRLFRATPRFWGKGAEGFRGGSPPADQASSSEHRLTAAKIPLSARPWGQGIWERGAQEPAAPGRGLRTQHRAARGTCPGAGPGAYGAFSARPPGSRRQRTAGPRPGPAQRRRPAAGEGPARARLAPAAHVQHARPRPAPTCAAGASSAPRPGGGSSAQRGRRLLHPGEQEQEQPSLLRRRPALAGHWGVELRPGPAAAGEPRSRPQRHPGACEVSKGLCFRKRRGGDGPEELAPSQGGRSRRTQTPALRGNHLPREASTSSTRSPLLLSRLSVPGKQHERRGAPRRLR